MLPLATHCHTHYCLHPFHFVLLKFKALLAKQHPTNNYAPDEVWGQDYLLYWGITVYTSSRFLARSWWVWILKASWTSSEWHCPGNFSLKRNARACSRPCQPTRLVRYIYIFRPTNEEGTFKFWGLLGLVFVTRNISSFLQLATS